MTPRHRVFVAAHQVHSHGGMQAYMRAFVDALRGTYQVDLLTRDSDPSPGTRRTRSLRKPFALCEQALASTRSLCVIADQVQTATALTAARRARRGCFVYAAEITGGEHRRLKGLVLRQQHRVWGITRWARDYVIEEFGLDESRVGVLTPPVDCNVFKPRTDDERDSIRKRLGVDARRAVVLCVGRLDPVAAYKGIDLTIQAAGHLRDFDPIIIVVGAGSDLGRLQGLSNGADVRFPGAVSTDALLDYFAIADVFSMPSHASNFGSGVRTEGFGIVFLEAAACGVPSVRGVAPGTAEAVIDGITATTAEPDSESVAIALRRWIDADATARSRTAGACRKWALQHSVERFAASVRTEMAALTHGATLDMG